MIPRTGSILLVVSLLLLSACRDAPPTSPEVRSDGTDSAPPVVVTRGGQEVTRFSAREDGASLQIYDAREGRELWAYLSAQRGGTGRAVESFLFYYIDECIPDPEDPWYWECRELEAGWGRIPQDAFQGRARNQIRLAVDTRGLPDFYHFAGEGLAVELAWTATRDFESQESGGGRYRWGTWGYRWSGNRTSTSARVEGRFGSMTLPASGMTFGDMSTSSGMNLYFERHGG